MSDLRVNTDVMRNGAGTISKSADIIAQTVSRISDVKNQLGGSYQGQLRDKVSPILSGAVGDGMRLQSRSVELGGNLNSLASEIDKVMQMNGELATSAFTNTTTIGSRLSIFFSRVGQLALGVTATIMGWAGLGKKNVPVTNIPSKPTPGPTPSPAPSLLPKSNPASVKKLPPIKDFALDQGDKDWANIKMNNQTGETLRNYGCLMTVVSMISRINGVNTNPALVDKWIEMHGGYPTNASYMSTKMQVDFLNDTLNKKGSMSTIYTENSTNHGLPNIDKNLDMGIPVILHIDSNSNPKDGHFVIAVGKDAKGNYLCADPNGGKEAIVSVNKIRDARVYK